MINKELLDKLIHNAKLFQTELDLETQKPDPDRKLIAAMAELISVHTRLIASLQNAPGS